MYIYIYIFRHIGYSHEDDLPINRGFDQGIYSHQGLQYYARSFQRSISRLDSVWGEPASNIKSRRDNLLGKNFKIKIHDTYSIGKNDNDERVEIPAFVWGNHVDSYSEDLYTEGVKSHIAKQNGNKPFFIYYSQWTPHASIVQPPNIRPDGTSMNYSVCYDAFPDRVEANCSLYNDTRCVFCKQGISIFAFNQNVKICILGVELLYTTRNLKYISWSNFNYYIIYTVHYASQNIKEIIYEIKNNSNINWDETVVIITSDNGAAPTAKSGLAYGSALPYRGVKS